MGDKGAVANRQTADGAGQEGDTIILENTRERLRRLKNADGTTRLVLSRLVPNDPARDLARLHVSRMLADLVGPETALPVVALEPGPAGTQLALEDMDFVPLGALIPPDGMRLKPLIAAMLAVTEAVLRLHRDGILHRDLRPDRILMSADCGAAKFLCLDAATDQQGQSGATAASLGTPFTHTPPELTGRIDNPTDERSDLYALGAVFYQMFTGKLPYPLGDAAALSYAHMAHPVPSASDIRPDLPAVLDKIAQVLMAKDPDDRYLSADDLFADLGNCSTQFQKSGTIRGFDLTRSGVSSRFRLSDRLFGRVDAHEALIRAAREGAFQGKRTVVSVSGPSGIGKSSFVLNTQWALGQNGARLVMGKFDRFRQDEPYIAFIQAAQALLRPLLATDDATLAESREQLGRVLGPFARLLTDLIPELSIIMGPQPEVEDVPPAEAILRFTGLVGRFLKIFVTPETPLVVFLDDMQWADHASHSMLKAIVTTPGLDHLMFVLGYRSNEVTPDRPIYRVLRDAHENADHEATIALGELSVKDTAAWLHASLGQMDDNVQTLAASIHQISDGNAFFMHEMATSLARQGLFRFDPYARSWVFDISDLKKLTIPDQVVGLLAERMDGLPAETLGLLDICSCIGNTFDLETVAKVSRQPPAQVALALQPAINATIIHSVDENHRVYAALGAMQDQANLPAAGGVAQYRFRHDQIRQKVHDRLSEDGRAERHFQIAQLLCETGDDAETSARAVEIFRHVLWAVDQIRTPPERLRYARIGVRAGQLASAGLAFTSAANFLDHAERLMPGDPWKSQPALMQDLRLTQAGAAFALGDRQRLETISLEILARSDDPDAIAQAQGNRIRFFATENKFEQAADICIETCAKLGVRLPRKPTLAHVLAEAGRTLVPRMRKDPMDYVTLPEAQDKHKIAAIEVMCQSAAVAYFAEPNLLPLIGIASSRLSLTHGRNPQSPYAFAVLALVMCGPLGMQRQGYKYGTLALETAKFYGGRDASRAEFVFNTFVRHWREPLSNVVEHLHDSWVKNRDAGDQENAVYSAGVLLYSDFFSGRALGPDVKFPQLKRYLHATDMPHVKDCFISWLTLFDALRKEVLPDELSDEHFDYPSKLPAFLADDLGVQIAISAISSGVLDFLAGRYARAQDRFDLAAKYEENIVSQPLIPGLAFMRGVNALRLARQDPSQAVRLRRIAWTQRMRLKFWSREGRVNIEHRLLLLDAERLALRGRPEKALWNLHHAAALAGSEAPFYGYMAHARRAEILSENGDASEAAIAARQAAEQAENWGARAVANKIRRDYDLGGPDAGQGALDATRETLDLAGFMDIVDAAASETAEGALLSRVLPAILRAANAESGAIVLPGTDHQWEIQTLGALDQAISGPLPLDKGQGARRRVLDFCLNSGTRVIGGTSQANDIMSGLQGDLPKAFLGVPIRLAERTTGAVYLEHGQSPHAFDAARADYAQAFANQAGIALENARLLTEVKTALSSQIIQTDATRRFVPEQLMKELGTTTITDVGLNQFAEREMTAVFADIRGFTTIAQEIGAERTIELINRYLDHVQPGIAAHGGFVGNYFGDGLLALFPDGADQALFGMLAMAQGLAGFNANRGDLPILSFGLGAHIGPVTIGMIGDPDQMQCGVLGDAVNLASRMEEMNKTYATQSLISGDCLGRLRFPERFTTRYLGRQKMRGRTADTEIHEFLDVLDDEKRAAITANLPVFAKAVNAMQSGESARAGDLFAQCDAAANGDATAARLAEICRR